MNNSMSTLDRHFRLPSIHQFGAARPFLWLSRGWRDMRMNLGASLSYGLLYAVFGYAILAYASDLPYLFTAAVSGFFLVGPIAACGLFEISRRQEGGEQTSFAESLRGVSRNSENLMYFGLFLAIVLIGWERLSAILFALFYAGDAPDLANLYRDVFLSGRYTLFVAAYLLAGGVLAATVFTLSATAVPMLMDRDTDVITAAMASAKAVSASPGAAIVWAALIVVLIGIGFATTMTGMILLLPLVGHASWHAYRDLLA